jgi:hypothetical protein
MLTKKITKITAPFVCEDCDYICSKKSYWDRHIMTAKHQRLTSVNTLLSPIKSIYNCNICNKKYNSRVGLWKHTKNCNNINANNINANNINANNINANNINESIIDSSNNEIKILTHLVLEVVKNNTELQKQNQDFQKQVLDVCQNIQPSTILK